MFLSIIALLGFLIYKNETTPKDNNEDNNIEINEPISEEEIYIDDNPIIVGLYKNYKDGKKRKLITEYTSNWEYHKDISSFEVYYTQDEEISNSSQIKSFDYYKDKYENIDNYKIGYIVSFNTNDKEINKTIYRPKDTEELFEYLELYLYDDYHRTGGWYSHTTDEEFNDTTLLTSIKLTAGKRIKDINSSIKITAFIYDKNKDIDDNNNYLGNSKYTIIVNKEGN